MIDRPLSPLFFQRGHKLHDISSIIFVDTHAALPQQNHLLKMREKPYRCRSQSNFFKVCFIATLTVDKATRLPGRQFTLLKWVLRMHVPYSPCSLLWQCVAIMPPLIGTGSVKHPPVNIACKARKIILQPVGVILFPHTFKATWPANI